MHRPLYAKAANAFTDAWLPLLDDLDPRASCSRAKWKAKLWVTSLLHAESIESVYITPCIGRAPTERNCFLSKPCLLLKLHRVCALKAEGFSMYLKPNWIKYMEKSKKMGIP
jgi:hypothetical protein